MIGWEGCGTCHVLPFNGPCHTAPEVCARCDGAGRCIEYRKHVHAGGAWVGIATGRSVCRAACVLMCALSRAGAQCAARKSSAPSARSLRMGGARVIAYLWRYARHAGGTTRTLRHEATGFLAHILFINAPDAGSVRARVRAQARLPGGAGGTPFLVCHGHGHLVCCCMDSSLQHCMCV